MKQSLKIEGFYRVDPRGGWLFFLHLGIFILALVIAAAKYHRVKIGLFTYVTHALWKILVYASQIPFQGAILDLNGS